MNKNLNLINIHHVLDNNDRYFFGVINIYIHLFILEAHSNGIYNYLCNK